MDTEAMHHDNHPRYNSRSSSLKKDSRQCQTPESNFFAWLEAWWKRVGLDAFDPHCRSLSDILKNGPKNCSTLDDCWHGFASDIIEKWHVTTHPGIVGCDQFVWTILANAILAKRQRNHNKECELRRKIVPDSMLCLLLWTGYYLKVTCKGLVQALLEEIVSCCGHLRFVFALLSGISFEEYVRYMGIADAAFHDKLCQKYFEDIAKNASVYQERKHMLLYIIEHLTPLHNEQTLLFGYSPSFTLSQVINSPIIPHKRAFSLLSVAIARQDTSLVKALLKLGACGCTSYYYPLLDQTLSGERILIHYINSVMSVRSFLVNSTSSISDSNAEELVQDLLPKLNILDEIIDQVSTYAPMIRRSVYHSEMKKANNQWLGRGKDAELHSDIADKWNVGDKRTFPSLQHACRITIRHQILDADKNLLPEAIAGLPLPGIMKRYLNLELD